MMNLGIGLELTSPGQSIASSVIGGPSLTPSPTPPDGAAGWWKSYSGVFSDAGTTPATLDATAVYRSNDNATSSPLDQSTLGLRPLLKLAQTVSGRDVLRYDGSDDYSVAALNGTAYSAVTVGLLFRPLNDSGTKGVFQFASALTSGVPFVLIQRNTTDTRVYVDNGYQWTIPQTTTDFAAFVLTGDGTTWKLWVNGAQQSNYTGVLSNKANAQGIYIGNGFNGYSSMDFVECLVYSTATDPQAVLLSDYLMEIGGL